MKDKLGIRRITGDAAALKGLAEFCVEQGNYHQDRILNLPQAKSADDAVRNEIERAELVGHSKAYAAFVEELQKAAK